MEKEQTLYNEYISRNGKHFNKKAYMYAVSKLCKYNQDSGKYDSVTPWSLEDVDIELSRQAVFLDNDFMYDSALIFTWAESRFLGNSLKDDESLALFVKDIIDNCQGAEGAIFDAWVSICGGPDAIEWESLI